ncbi:MAG: FAD-dependent oxidoreductase [Stackebrandtia sp.]
MSTVQRVLIAGGGIGGLATAVALRRRGVETVVVERAAAFRDVGSGLVLAPNGMKALAALDADLAADVRLHGNVFGPDHDSRFMTSSGKTLSRVSFGDVEKTWGVPVLAILRSKLHDVMLRHALAAGAEIRGGAEVVGYSDGGDAAAATLADGSTVEADLMIGADGVKSAVRRQLLDDGDPEYRGYTAVRGVGKLPASDPHGFLAYGRGLILFAAAIGDGRAYWVASLNSAPDVWPRKTPRTAHGDLTELLAGWHPDLSAMAASADPDECVLTDVVDRDPVGVWHRGRVALLGDAAHPMTYTMGQGANTTLQDAVVLAHHLDADGPLDAALAAYTAERAPQTAKIVKQSRMMGNIGQVANPVGAWFRNRMMTLMGRFGDPDKQNAELYGWTPPRL